MSATTIVSERRTCTVQSLLTPAEQDASLKKKTEVEVHGWVSSVRKSGSLAFIELQDGSCLHTAQLVVEKKNKEAFEAAQKVTFKCTIEARGVYVKLHDLKNGKLAKPEINCTMLRVVGVNGDNFPLVKADMSMEFLRTHLHLRPRTNTFYCLNKIQSELQAHIPYSPYANFWATHKYFHGSRRFQLIRLPFITDSACEGGCAPLQVTSLLHTGKLQDVPTVKEKRDPAIIGPHTELVDFSKDFFKGPRYLTVSAQMHLECFLPMGNVYTETRAFRGEPSQTTRHLAEFTMIEWEQPWITLEDDMKTAEEYVQDCITHVLQTCTEEMVYLLARDADGAGEKHMDRLMAWSSEPFARTTHKEAVQLLQKHAKDGKATFRTAPKEDEDLAGEHERYLTDVVYGKPVFVCHYPKKVKAFYMPTLPGDDAHVDCFDLLVPGLGELIGGSMRIDDPNVLLKRMEELKMDVKALDWYVDLRRYGSVPHGGAGLGFERLVQWVTLSKSIKDCLPFPRAIGDCTY